MEWEELGKVECQAICCFCMRRVCHIRTRRGNWQKRCLESSHARNKLLITNCIQETSTLLSSLNCTRTYAKYLKSTTIAFNESALRISLTKTCYNISEATNGLVSSLYKLAPLADCRARNHCHPSVAMRLMKPIICTAKTISAHSELQGKWNLYSLIGMRKDVKSLHMRWTKKTFSRVPTLNAFERCPCMWSDRDYSLEKVGALQGILQVICLPPIGHCRSLLW